MNKLLFAILLVGCSGESFTSSTEPDADRQVGRVNTTTFTTFPPAEESRGNAGSPETPGAGGAGVPGGAGGASHNAGFSGSGGGAGSAGASINGGSAGAAGTGGAAGTSGDAGNTCFGCLDADGSCQPGTEYWACGTQVGANPDGLTPPRCEACASEGCNGCSYVPAGSNTPGCHPGETHKFQAMCISHDDNGRVSSQCAVSHGYHLCCGAVDVDTEEIDAQGCHPALRIQHQP